MAHIFRRLRLQLPDFSAPFTLYPDYNDAVSTASLTQGGGSGECPVALVSKRCSPSERKLTPAERLVDVVMWAVRKLRRYVTFAPYTEVVFEEESVVALVGDQHAHLKIRAAVLDLSMYRIRWKVGRG